MKYEFKVYQMQVEDHFFWVAKSESLKGCVGQGETVDEAIKELELNEAEWLDTAKEYGISIPPVSVRSENTFSGKVSLRFSPFTHEEASNNAKAQGVSLNQYINDAIVYYNGLIKNSQKTTSRQISNTTVFESNTTSVIDINNYRHKTNNVTLQLSEDLEEM